MRLSRRSRLLLALAAPALLAGCGGGSSGAAAPAVGPASLSGSVTVLAAASLTGAFTTLGQQFEAAHPGTHVVFSFGASSALAQQIANGAPADVFASASEKNMAAVVGAGDAASPRTFATNTAEVAVAPASAGTVKTLADLARPGVKVALCQAEVPCGALADKVLAKAGVTVEPVTRGLDVKAVLATVTSGEVDAAIVYATDVRAAGAKVVGVPIPADVYAGTAYPIATVTTTRNAALAQAFEDYVLSTEGQAVLTSAGFAAP
jgi:molybdate transport system substrate-binding protein